MNISERVRNTSLGVASGITAVALSAMPVLAEEGAANADVVSAFTSAAGEIKSTVVAIAGVAVAILVVMYAFKWGKKIFNRVAS